MRAISEHHQESLPELAFFGDDTPRESYFPELVHLPQKGPEFFFFFRVQSTFSTTDFSFHGDLPHEQLLSVLSSPRGSYRFWAILHNIIQVIREGRLTSGFRLGQAGVVLYIGPFFFSP
jgi:hypothetical protein